MRGRERDNAYITCDVSRAIMNEAAGQDDAGTLFGVEFFFS